MNQRSMNHRTREIKNREVQKHEASLFTIQLKANVVFLDETHHRPQKKFITGLRTYLNLTKNLNFLLQLTKSTQKNILEKFRFKFNRRLNKRNEHTIED